MFILRDRLKESQPELYAALERSWMIANDEWLPAVSPSSDSYNSYPHLRNMENYLEQILSEYETIRGSAVPPLLSPVELYVTLSAILFHDIGRLFGSTGHGEKSRRIIMKDFAKLGIPSEGFARVLADIAKAHDLSPSNCEEWLRLHLSAVTISPYREIRQRLCAVLLILVDHLDGAFTRVVPEYARPTDSYEVVGAFRRMVRGVTVDLQAQMVKVVLSDDLNKHKPPEEGQTYIDKIGDFDFIPNISMLSREALCIEKKTPGRSKDVNFGMKEGIDDAMQKVLLELFRALKPKFDDKSPDGDLGITVDSNDEMMANVLDLLDFPEGKYLREGNQNPLYSDFGLDSPEPHSRLWLVARGLLLARRRKIHRSLQNAVKNLQLQWTELKKKESNRSRSEKSEFFRELHALKLKDLRGKLSRLSSLIKYGIWSHPLAAMDPSAKPKSWPPELLLAIVLGNTWENKEALEPIGGILSAVGAPIKAWLLESDEHLYNRWGQETYEPIFHRGYLLDIARAMWKLSITVFAHSTFSYHTLAAQLRDPDVERVRRAVRRISIVSSPKDGTESECPIWAGQTQWRWIVKPRDPQEEELSCDYIGLDAVTDCISTLRSPGGGEEE
jgi:hypothetical protein